ncbi:MAG: hypothetical protein Q9221_001010 [Calogaya cf. arnoldii]
MRPISLCLIILTHVISLCYAHLLPHLLSDLLPQANCSSCLPNPLATTYPDHVTGTINATTAVVLIPLSYAQSLLPARFANSILTNAYTRFNIPPTQYPLVVESVIDHDIRYSNLPVAPDFSSFRTTFPFIDLLGDGYSAFRYTGHIYLPPNNLVAINGSQGYGYTVHSGYFDPPDAPYKPSRARNGRSSNVFNVYEHIPSHAHNHHQPPPIKLTGFSRFRPAIRENSIPLAFYKNVTNQIMFGNNSHICDRMTSFWNTSITTRQYEPEPVIGDVLLSPPFVEMPRVWAGVQGMKANRAFLEVNYLDCKGLKGWSGTGDGDSG